MLPLLCYNTHLPHFHCYEQRSKRQKYSGVEKKREKKDEIRFSVKKISPRRSSHPRQDLVTLSSHHHPQCVEPSLLPTLRKELPGHFTMLRVQKKKSSFFLNYNIWQDHFTIPLCITNCMNIEWNIMVFRYKFDRFTRCDMIISQRIMVLEIPVETPRTMALIDKNMIRIIIVISRVRISTS